MTEVIKDLPLKRLCPCLCAEGGPCGHKWDGPFKYYDNKGQATEDKKKAITGSASCSICGTLAISHDIERG